ncbi:hypothetical protein ACJ72_03077 [Emergomyces africanus]|uniref:Peptidase M3A/M3B catalytic domain-containing protein n=1 Tax=Emergomyces africanus TaxID=1955775 RepID=A0A1B7P0L1_9EURO|nr:hypothetical protein ACJ72_03077 [Emergomyces africanus]
MAPSKLRNPPQAPPVFTATPSSLIADTKRIIESSRKVQDTIAANVTADEATFAKVLLPMAQDENVMALESHILGFYQAVSIDSKLRDASSEAEKLMDDFAIESAMREDLFNLVAAALKKGEKLDPESQNLLEKEHKDFIRNGLGIPAGPQRDRFKEIKKRLSQISIEFQKNLNEENGGLWFTREELDGVPEDVLSGLKKGEGENEGKLRLTFKYPDLFPTLKYATNSEVRKQVMIANENKCNQNVPLFKEAVILRDEAARLLGYPNHATFRIEDKMAKTPKTVNDFLGDLRSRLKSGGLKELEALKALKKTDIASRDPSQSFEDRYYLWDHRFYDRMMLEKQFSINHQLIAEYFPLQTTIRGMLKIFEELFGLVFVEITGDERDKISTTGKGNDIVWHDEVQVFSVWDDEGEGSGFVGYLYLDLFPREGKYGHAANFNLQPHKTPGQLCRCSDSQASVDTMVMRVGGIHPGLRSHVRHLIGFEGDLTAGTVVPWNMIMIFGDSPDQYYMHEAAHCIYRGFNKTSDMELFTEVGVLYIYDNRGKSLRQRGFDPSCLSNGLKVFGDYAGEDFKEASRCFKRRENSPIVHLTEA